MNPGDRVRVRFNLRRGDFSVMRAGRVIAHVGGITLTGVVFRVQPAGLERIRRMRQRAVCAYAVGAIAAVNTHPGLTGLDRVTFNPYRADTFTCRGEPIHEAPAVVFTNGAGWVDVTKSASAPAPPSAQSAPSPASSAHTTPHRAGWQQVGIWGSDEK